MKEREIVERRAAEIREATAAVTTLVRAR